VAGDEIWLLKGAGVPVVLQASEDETYRLIGGAYVYGIMHKGVVSPALASALQSIVLA
jgi:hypothetical protein